MLPVAPQTIDLASIERQGKLGDTRFRIRRAGSLDLIGLSQLGRFLGLQTWSYLYDPEDLEVFLNQCYTAQAIASDLDRGAQCWVAEVQLPRQTLWHLAAHMKAMPPSLPKVPPGKSIELKQLYVDRSLLGSGLAHHMMQQFFLAAIQQQATQWVVSCYSGNHRAMAFYQQLGAKEIGQYGFVVGRQVDDERILAGDLQEGLRLAGQSLTA
ncbi:MAG: GNAT family N-acetyltransferase [Pirellulaceae bacterium]